MLSLIEILGSLFLACFAIIAVVTHIFGSKDPISVAMKGTAIFAAILIVFVVIMELI